mgnify:CR=1 FL=1
MAKAGSTPGPQPAALQSAAISSAACMQRKIRICERVEQGMVVREGIGTIDSFEKTPSGAEHICYTHDARPEITAALAKWAAVSGVTDCGVAAHPVERVGDAIAGLRHQAPGDAERGLLQPLVVGRIVRLHPLAIIVVLAVGGIVAGIPGAIIAVPAAAQASCGNS